MERYCLPRRAGLNSSCEEEFDQLVSEIVHMNQNYAQQHQKLEIRNNVLETECNDIKQRNELLKQQLMYLDNACKSQITELQNELKILQKGYNEQRTRNKEEINQCNQEKQKLRDEKITLEKQLMETKSELNRVKKAEEKLVSTINNLNQKLNSKEDTLNTTNEKRPKKFPKDKEVEALAKSISDHFLNEESLRYKQVQKKIMNKIQDIEVQMNLTYNN